MDYLIEYNGEKVAIVSNIDLVERLIDLLSKDYYNRENFSTREIDREKWRNTQR